MPLHVKVKKYITTKEKKNVYFLNFTLRRCVLHCQLTT